MSLLTNPKHSLTVQRYAKTEGSIGQNDYSPAGDPVTVRGNKHPLTAEETTNYGLQNFTTVAFHCLTWPGDQHSMISLDGSDWEQIGDPKLYGMSTRTQHYEVILKKRGA